MLLPEKPPAATPVAALRSQHPDSHYQHLQDAIPDWVGNASAVRRQALKDAQPRLDARLLQAPEAQHRELMTLNAAHINAQSDIDRQLEHLQDARAFAEPLLKAALKSHFNLDLDVTSTFVRLYIPKTIPWFAVMTGARAWTVSMLDAALHNFEEAETTEDAFESDSCFITQPTPTGQFDTLPALKNSLSITAFATLCRALDTGARYTEHLKDSLGFSDPMIASALRLNVDESHKASMRAALQWARMNRDVSESCADVIAGLLDGLQGMRLNGHTMLSHSVSMMSAQLTGIVVFAPDLDQAQNTARVVAYVPDDPEHPFKEYASALEMAVELTRQLRSKDYQRFFSRFVNQEQRGFFFANLNDRLSKVTWHPPVPGNQEPVWRETPLERPNLQTGYTPIAGNLWHHLYQTKLNKILNDAQVIAVPTASVDQKVRWAFWDSVVSIASTILQTAAFIIAPFVPVLGEAMLAYMAYQLLDETFEGVVEWAQGQTTEAFEHLMGTVESLIQLGTFAVGGAVVMGEYRKVLPQEIVAFIDRFKPVKRPDGQTRYWKPDLKRYEYTGTPGADSKPDELGLHSHKGKHLLPLEDTHYRVSQDALTEQFQIEHPSRADAYQPQVRHNGDGAWHTELEQPLEWDKPTVLRRIGHSVESFTPVQRERILQVSGYNENALRKMHVNQEPLPPVLGDTIKRFKIDQDINQFIDQLNSDLPEAYLKADPRVQLQLLNDHGKWPADRRLRLLDTQGEVLWQSSTDETAPLTDIRQDRLRDNDVLKTLVHSLEEQQIKTLLGEEFGGPQFTVERRTETLRKQLAQFAWEQRALTFESRYQTLERLDDPLAEAITRLEPGLPVSVTRELLGTANGDELLLISEGHVPPRQQQLVQLASQEVRIARAFEGLELDCVNNADSHTLALHSLKALPGWTATVRIEIRERYYEGALLDSTGPATAPQQKVIVRNADGTYQPFDDRGQELHGATDFYSSVLHALPDAERQALNVQIGQANTLKDAIRAHPLERSELRLAIAPSPIELPAVDTLRLVGSDGYRRIERVRPAQRPLIPEAPEVADILPPLEIERGISLEDRAREIYPGLSIEHAQAFVTRLETTPLGARGELSRLSNEYAQLATDLHRWAHDIPLTDPVSGRALSRTQRRAARRNRAIFKEAVQRCWRRETHGPAGYTLELREPIIGDLPTLDADLSFVSSLTISGTATTDGLDSYMQNFPGLRFLEVQNFDLQNLPQSIASMPNLQQLIARNCGLTVSPASQQILSSLPALTLLDLMDNPLAVAPDIQAMRSLKHLNLANTGISTLPVGLLEHPNAIVGRFDGNRISELPGAFFTLSAERSENFDFAYNPLSAAMRERVKIHYNRTGRHFGVLAELADIQRARTLFPELDTTEATGLLYRLRGTLVQGREQLTRWEAELVQLTSDLTQWSSDIPEVNPISGLPLDGPQRANTQAARTRFGQQLERAWRTRSRQTFVSTLLFVGELPRLSADFGHVDGLTLIGNNGVSAVPEFLGHFQGLRHVSLHEFALGDVPHTLTSMPQLETLVLENCAVALTPQSQTLLSSLKRLDTLELTKNPLGLTPDLASLPGLTYLDLSGSEISTVPAGLAEHAGLITALLSDNRISELPESLFELSADRSEGIDFGGNPLSTESRDAIKRYFQKTGQDFGVQANADDIAVAQALFPSMDGQDASDLIYDLPGTLQAGHLQLQRWRVEFKQMLGDLRIWERNVPDVHPVTGEPLSAAHMYAEHVSRAEFSQHLEAFWRRRSAARVRDDHFVASLNFWGDMPELTTDFSHVSNLALDGNNVNRATGSFLDRFANVHTLEMKGFALERLPQSLSGLTALQDLNLRRCRLTLTPENQTTLSSLSNLQHLNLSDNPLGAAPDLDALTSLTHLHLSHTGIAELPGGLIDAQNLITAILDGNQISELPDALFDIFPEIADGINLGNNPISSTSRERIKAYYRRHGQDFAVLAERADIDRARELSSGLSIEEASQMIYSLPGTLEDGRAQLTLWEAELFELGRNLAEWADDIAGHDRTTGEPVTPADLNAQKLERSEFSHGLTEFWRKRFAVRPDGDADTFMTVLAFNGELPALAADFKHVSTLSLTGNRDLSIGAGFLDGFTGLQQLELRAFQLGRLPEAIKGMPALERLTLSNCAIVLDADSRSVFSALPRLEALDLCSNPLGQVPDIAALPALTYIDLSSTGIDQLPAALATHPALEIAILSSNRIAELPPEFYDLPAQTSEGFDVGNNPLTEATREQIKRYYRQSEEDFGVLAALEDIDQVKDLYPGFSSEQASEFVYRLPGSLAEGRLELARKLAELQALLSDLTVWTTDIPNHPVTREPLAPPALLQEQYKRRLFKDSLELCWRRVQTSALQSDEYGFFSNQPILGDLPVLTADFGHVREVYLTTPGSIAPLGAGRFLEYFPNLTRLTVRGYPLQSLPDAVFNMKALQALSLPECGIRLTQATVDALSGMTDLNSLNLRNNPLGMSLDLSNLSELIALDLSNAELTEVPQGLFTHTHLRLADLSNNLITAMPIELMEANPALTANFNFNGNPLSPQSLQRVVAHYYETGNPLGIPEATGMPRPADLPPDVEMES